VSRNWKIVLDVWVAIEKLVAPAPDEDSSKQKDEHRDRECDPQRRNARLFNHRHPNEAVHVHAERVSARSIGFYDASVGFLVATEGGIEDPSFGVGVIDAL
jgi:hypothetical protein